MKRKWMIIVAAISLVLSIGLFVSQQIALGVLLLLGAIVLVVLFFVLPKPKKSEPVYEFKVAGVSFNNDDGKDRQAIIREIRAGRQVNVTLRPYQYNGHPAIAVFAGNDQLGNVPSELVPEYSKIVNRCKVVDYKVLGSGKEAPFGFWVKLSV